MIVTLTGPTCGGKSTLERALQAKGWGRAISHTTRPAREGEVAGQHYHFINDSTFEALHARGDFIETVDLGTRRYAMSKQALREADAQGHVVIVCEPQGAGAIADYCKAQNLPHLAVWVNCSPEIRSMRWMTRTVQELDQVPVSERYRKVKDAEERLALMLGVEQKWESDKTWFSGPKAHPHLYRLFIEAVAPPARLAEEVTFTVDQLEAIRRSTCNTGCAC